MREIDIRLLIYEDFIIILRSVLNEKGFCVRVG